MGLVLNYTAIRKNKRSNVTLELKKQQSGNKFKKSAFISGNQLGIRTFWVMKLLGTPLHILFVAFKEGKKNERTG